MTDRPLYLAWALLMGLTLLTGLAGVGGAEHLGPLWLAVLAVVTVFKARVILARYLRLAAAPSFLGGFTAAVVAVVLLVSLSVMVLTKPLMSAKPLPRAPVSHAPNR